MCANNEDNRNVTYRPLEHSQRGDSGRTSITSTTWMTDGSAWIADGIRHDQLVGTLNVPNVCMQPTRSQYSALYSTNLTAGTCSPSTRH